MFLKSLSHALLILSLFVSPAFADSLGIETGKYKLIKGDSDLCGESFSISNKDLAAGKISLGENYLMVLKNSVTKMESDLDPNCEFRQVTSKEVRASETIVVRSNSEFCKDVKKSETTSTVSFRGGRIHLQHSLWNRSGPDSYPCEWQRQ